jgi:hypothetical protein
LLTISCRFDTQLITIFVLLVLSLTLKLQKEKLPLTLSFHMKKIFTFLTLALCLGLGVNAQTSGGPDSYGYTWKNSNHPTTPPVYNWINIKGLTGTQLVTGLGDDNVVGPFNIGFTFQYYWLPVTQFYLGSNGYISFSPVANIASTSIGFPSIPTSSPTNQNHLICPMMCDLNFADSTGQVMPGNPGNVYYYTNATADSLIITYDSVPFYANSSYRGINTFQIILSKLDSSITFQYKEQVNSWDDDYNAVTNPLVVGIENVSGQIGLQVSNNALPVINTAIKFYAPASTSLAITDIQVDANFNAENGGIFILKDVPFAPTTILRNVGNQDITGAVRCSTSVYSPSGAVPITGSLAGKDFTGGLVAGATGSVTQDTMWTPTLAGTYYLRGQASGVTGDPTPLNNRSETELVVIDSGINRIVLTYDIFPPFDSALTTFPTGFGTAGFGNNNGIAVYYEPPFYPAVIDTLSMVFITTSVPSPFTLSLLDDDNGAPGQGTVIASGSFNAPNPNTFGPATFGLTTPFVITSGGVYLEFIQNGDSTFLVSDETAPFSNRTYEVLAGNWATHRSRSTEDYALRVHLIGGTTQSDASVNGPIGGLNQNYPNPATESTTVEFALFNEGNATFTVTNLQGQVIEKLDLGLLGSGSHKVNLNTQTYTSGLYLYSLKVGSQVLTRKMSVQH